MDKNHQNLALSHNFLRIYLKKLFTVQKMNVYCSMIEHMKKQDHFEVLRKIQKKPNSTQRELAEELGFSLGKLNYCPKALQSKGLVKIENFKKIQTKLIIFTF